MEKVVPKNALKNFIAQELERVKKNGKYLTSSLQMYTFLKRLNTLFEIQKDFPSWEQLWEVSK